MSFGAGSFLEARRETLSLSPPLTTIITSSTISLVFLESKAQERKQYVQIIFRLDNEKIQLFDVNLKRDFGLPPNSFSRASQPPPETPPLT